MLKNDVYNPLAMFMKDIRRFKRLPKEREIELAKLYQETGDQTYIDELVNANLTLVIWLSKKMSAWDHSRLQPSEIISIGLEHLFKAALVWQPNGDAAFAAFARHFIIRGITRQGDKEDRIIQLPLNISEKIRKLKFAERKLLQKHGREPKVSELAEASGFTEKRVKDLQTIIRSNPISLDQMMIATQYKEKSQDEFDTN
jgi:RNA polymerase sigma-32 factor